VVRGTRDVVDPFGDHYPIPNQILENFTRRRLFTL
jgi:hypothetical protein